MRFRVTRILVALLFLGSLSSLYLHQTAAPAFAGQPPCTESADNMTRNGSVTDGGYPTVDGVVANEWKPFVRGGSAPAFDLADNESANGDIPGSSSQYIHGDGVEFDAGIYQTIPNTQPGAYYEFSVGWAAMLRDTGGGHNTKVDDVIARQVGADPFGGTDPNSKDVIWGPELWTGSSGKSLNSPNMRLLFAAQSDHVTVFVRVYNRGTSASDKVFLDVICLLPKPFLPTATLVSTAAPSATPTLTPTPSPTGTDTPVATNTVVVAAAAVSSPTKVTATRPPTRTPKPTTAVPTKTVQPTLPLETPETQAEQPVAPQRVAQVAATATRTPTTAPSAKPTRTPRVRPTTSGVSTETSASDGSNLTSMAVLVGSVGIIGFSSFGLVLLGAFLIWRTFLRR